MFVNSRSQTRIGRLARKLESKKFRDNYMSRQIKAFLASQIRAVRGTSSQADFGKIIGKPQSVVSRLEDEDYGKVSIRTLIDIAQKLDVGLIVRFVDFPTFLQATGDYSDSAFAPESYKQDAINELAEEEERRADLDTPAKKLGNKQSQLPSTEAHDSIYQTPLAGSLRATHRQRGFGPDNRSAVLKTRGRHPNPQLVRSVQVA